MVTLLQRERATEYSPIPKRFRLVRGNDTRT